ncbi:hypothetical protein BH24PSE2_BH24PSE2_02840 [soil metagenome]
MRALLVLLVVVWLPVQAAEIHYVDVDRDGTRYYFDSETIFHAPLASVYAVLTDYDDFKRISRVFTHTRFLEPVTDGVGIIYTRARGCILFFCRTVVRVERLELDPMSEIVAIADPERSDVKYSRAHWQFEETDRGTRVRYRMEMEPDFWVPPVLGPWMLKRSLTSNGEEVVARIEYLARERAGLISRAER